jgi:hypothetical protein
MQSVIDAAPHARRYFSDAFNTYRELCYWGEHRATYDKSESSSVEGDNAELRHYLVRFARCPRCFSKCIGALRRAVELFVWCWNWRQTPDWTLLFHANGGVLAIDTPPLR